MNGFINPSMMMTMTVGRHWDVSREEAENAGRRYKRSNTTGSPSSKLHLPLVPKSCLPQLALVIVVHLHYLSHLGLVIVRSHL